MRTRKQELSLSHGKMIVRSQIGMGEPSRSGVLRCFPARKLNDRGYLGD